MHKLVSVSLLSSLAIGMFGVAPMAVQAATYTCGGLRVTIVGTSGPDTLTGTPGVDVIVGLGGNDTIAGGSGNDFICGNEGNDMLYGNQGNDWMEGNQGGDVLYGGQNNDVMYGGQDHDQLYGNLGSDFLEGNLGFDILQGNEDRDTYSRNGSVEIGTLDMKAYCNRKYGTRDVERKLSDIYSWACEFKELRVGTGGVSYTTYTKRIDIEDVCFTMRGKNTYPVALNQKDANSWRCYQG